MEQQNIEKWATVLNEARLRRKAVPQIGPQLSTFLRADAYSIQEAQFRQRINTGERQVGWKMGLTSKAKREQMNLDSPLYGFLTDKMRVANGGSFDLGGSIHPKIEPEIAFLMGKDLPGKVSRDEALSAVKAVTSALEILDSRYEQFKYFSMEDVISDNSSSSHFILGAWREDFAELDLSELRMEMRADGKTAQQGIARDISGDPVISIVQLCELLAARGQTLKAGDIVLAGAATTAIELKPGLHVELHVDHLPQIDVHIVGGLS